MNEISAGCWEEPAGTSGRRDICSAWSPAAFWRSMASPLTSSDVGLCSGILFFSPCTWFCNKKNMVQRITFNGDSVALFSQCNLSRSQSTYTQQCFFLPSTVLSGKDCYNLQFAGTGRSPAASGQWGKIFQMLHNKLCLAAFVLCIRSSQAALMCNNSAEHIDCRVVPELASCSENLWLLLAREKAQELLEEWGHALLFCRHL